MGSVNSLLATNQNLHLVAFCCNKQNHATTFYAILKTATLSTLQQIKSRTKIHGCLWHLCDVLAAPKQQAQEMAPTQQAQDGPQAASPRKGPQDESHIRVSPKQHSTAAKVASYHRPLQGKGRFRSLRLKALHPCAAQEQAARPSLRLRTLIRAWQKRCFHTTAPPAAPTAAPLRRSTTS